MPFKTTKCLSWALGFCVAMFSIWAPAAAQTPEVKPFLCSESRPLELPPVPWMGEFVYKVALTAEGGHATAVQVEAVRGMDKRSDRAVIERLKTHIEQDYRCASDAARDEFYVRIQVDHDVPKQPSQAMAELLARLRDRQRSNASASAASEPSGAWASIESERATVCTVMNHPKPPTNVQASAKGTLVIKLRAYALDGKVIASDAKLAAGTQDFKFNQLFLDAATSAAAEYQCPGDHQVDQEFRFTLN